MIEIALDYVKTVNYALVHCKKAVCQELKLTNTGKEAVADLLVTCEGEFIESGNGQAVALLQPGESIRLKDFVIKPDANKLSQLTEQVASHIDIIVKRSEETLVRKSFDIDFMAYDQWLGTNTLPQMLAAFVTPNDPAIAQLIVAAAARLKEQTGESAFVEYQSGNPQVVLQQIAAIFAAIHDQGIVYRSVPASYGSEGQRVTLPYQVLESKLGNCIELTLLFASALEAVGIYSGVILKKGHAYLAAWLGYPDYNYSTCDDPSMLSLRTADGISKMVLLECTCVTKEDASFNKAITSAEYTLTDTDSFELYIDLYRCRLENYRPLPRRIMKDGVMTLEEGIEHGQCDTTVRQIHEADLTRLDNNKKELTRFDIWERRLLDLTLRNSLLNIAHHRTLQLMVNNVARIEDLLQGGKEFCIEAKPDIDIDFDQVQAYLHHPIYDQCAELLTTDLNHLTIHSFLPPSETKLTLKTLYRASRDAIEETGANSLFLSLGLLQWYETEESQQPRFAPLILLPVSLLYKRGSYFIRTRDEEVMLNITLMELLRQNYEITIDGLNPLPTDESGVDVTLILSAIRRAIEKQPRWDVLDIPMLGNFSFSKFVMWNDLHNNRELMLQNNVINSLVANQLTWKPEPMVGNLKAVDATLDPTQLALPVAVDSSQMAAVIEGGKGNSFILYGPPGTGKSQTITNLVANALYQGKRVLFVAEKMAALNVVQRRLEQIGLAPFCLELHSNKSTKRHVLGQLETALDVAHIARPEEYAKTAQALFEERKRLIAYMQALHTVSESTGLSLYDYFVRYEAIAEAPLKAFEYTQPTGNMIREKGFKALEELLGEPLDTIVKLVGHPGLHPLNEMHLTREEAANPEVFKSRFTELSNTVSYALEHWQELNETRLIRERLVSEGNQQFFAKDVKALKQQWEEANAKWFLPRYLAVKRFVKEMRAYNPSLTADSITPLLNNLTTYNERHEMLERLREEVRRFFAVTLSADQCPEQSLLTHFQERITHWLSLSSLLRDWQHWVNYREELLANGLDSVVNALEAPEEIASTTLRNSFFKALYFRLAELKINSVEQLSTFEGMLFDNHVKRYKKLSSEFQLLTQKQLYALLASKVPQAAAMTTANSEIGFLRRNINNGGRGVSLRDLLHNIPTLLPHLCPCMLMSPMSVSQYLDLKEEKFDIVIFDEASQMPTSEAVGAIARGKALIVVGDPKQMPPTSFFSSSNVEEEEAAFDDLESILEDCRALDIPSLQLNWHYRSRHESLITFSNNEYYDGSLITFPSVDDQKARVRLIPVEGCYDKGGRRSNRAEAEAIVREVERRLRDKELRKHSIGIIAFSVAQQSLIEDLLQEHFDNNKELRELANAMYEPMFVKNLENVQGDERDIILFSVGYGPDKDGKVSMNFGPLNNAGGERRLNVAVSRAREEMLVFSTLSASQIDLRRSKARGVEGLKHFLEFAETQTLTQSSSQMANDNIIASDIANALRQHGLITTLNVGRSHFKVDIAISRKETPDTYELGILLDGATYRDTQTTRDREIVQTSVLEALRWKVMRVWSIDWFNNRDRVVSRILECLNTPTDDPTDNPTDEQVFDISTEPKVEVATSRRDYTEYVATKDDALAMDDLQLVTHIVENEQPVTLNYLCRRFCLLREAGKVTSALQRKMLDIATTNLYVSDDPQTRFNVWLNKETAESWQWYRPAVNREIGDIPTTELKHVITETIAEQLAIPPEPLTLIAAKKLGFTRRGNNIDLALNNVIAQLLNDGIIETYDYRLRLKQTTAAN